MINCDSEVLKVIATASEEPQSVFWDGLFVVWSPGAGTGRTGSHPTRYTWRFAWNRLFIVHQRAASGLPKSKWRRPWPTASFTAIFTRWAIDRDHPEVKDVRCFNCASHKIYDDPSLDLWSTPAAGTCGSRSAWMNHCVKLAMKLLFWGTLNLYRLYHHWRVIGSV